MDRGGSIELGVLEPIPEEETQPMIMDEVRRSWLRRPEARTDHQHIDLGCMVCSRRGLAWALGLAFCALAVIVLPTILTKTLPGHRMIPPAPDNFTIALHQALIFFNAQKSGKLPRNNRISWRGDSGLQDGSDIVGGLVGGYYDSGNNMKCHFPMSFAMTILSWSLIEYEHKYRAVAEYEHIRELIKWGSDYLLLTFDSNATSIETIYSQVGVAWGEGNKPDDQYCWERPEDMEYGRPAQAVQSAPDLGAEMAAALAAASIVFREDAIYSSMLVKGAQTAFAFARDVGRRKPYSYSMSKVYQRYRSSGYWDEYVWGAAWMFCATGDFKYLSVATDPDLAMKAKAASKLPYSRVLSWDNKLPAAMLLLTRVRIFLNPGSPYEDMLMTYHHDVEHTMCSFLRRYHVFHFTPGGLIELDQGHGGRLQYAANSAFLASLYADYLRTSGIPGWQCGDSFFTLDTLKSFSSFQVLKWEDVEVGEPKQGEIKIRNKAIGLNFIDIYYRKGVYKMDYILGANPMNLSYVVGYGTKFPTHVHHRGASIPNNGIKYSCTGGWKWRDNPDPNPNNITGAMVGGPDNLDRFLDVRTNASYTEPTLAGNAGLVAALASLTRSGGSKVDKNTIFSAVQPFFAANPTIINPRLHPSFNTSHP